MGKNAREEREEAKRRQDAKEENDVSRRSEENRRITASEMGEGQGTEEIGLTVIEPSLWIPLENDAP
jgi:hypothetical protein